MKETKMPEKVYKLLLGVCGSSQAEYTPQFIESARQIFPKLEIIVVATHAAKEFFDIEAVEKLTNRKVFIDHRDFTEEFDVPHIQLAKWSDVILVYPASASTLAKCAHGICDSLLGTLVLASDTSVIFGPCMNEAMYINPITQLNIKTLKEFGHEMVPRVERPIYVYSEKEFIVKPSCTIAAAIYTIKNRFEKLPN